MPQLAAPRRQHAEERREQILDAALRVFAEKGFAGASVRDIAREVGVTEGLLYHYFESKEQLIHSCFTERCWRAHVERILVDSADAPVIDVLRALITDFLATLRENGPFVRMCASEMQRHSELAAAHLERIGSTQRLIGDFLRARQAMGELREEADVDTAAGLMLGCGHSIFLLLGQSPDEVWKPIAEGFIRSSVDVVMLGVAPRP